MLWQNLYDMRTRCAALPEAKKTTPSNVPGSQLTTSCLGHSFFEEWSSFITYVMSKPPVSLSGGFLVGFGSIAVLQRLFHDQLSHHVIVTRAAHHAA